MDTSLVYALMRKAAWFMLRARCKYQDKNMGTDYRRRRAIAVHTATFFLCAKVNAGVIADFSMPENRQPEVIQVENAAPQVLIQSPDEQGISHNTFSQFDIGPQGVIINNSAQGARAMSGDKIAGNPHLSEGEAKIIINEVNSLLPSQLEGMIEVVGSRASVIIANPAGIICDGCGFINAHTATLSAGAVQLAQGKLVDFSDGNGEVIIKGAGLLNLAQDHTKIIARSVKINANLWANDLEINTGVPGEKQLMPVDGVRAHDDGKPYFALDVSQLGGMYAGKIRLVGTERGLGVRNAGIIGSETSNTEILTNGRIVNAGNITGKNVQVKSSDELANSGKLRSALTMDINITGSLHNQGLISAGKQLAINAAELNSEADSAIATDLITKSKTVSGGILNIDIGSNLVTRGKIISGDQLIMVADELDVGGAEFTAKRMALGARHRDIHAVKSRINAKTSLRLTTPQSINLNESEIESAKLNLSAKALSNQRGKIVQNGSANMEISLADSLDNRNGLIRSEAFTLNINTESLNNSQGEISHLGKGALNINANHFQGNGGTLCSNSALSLEGGSFNLDSGKTKAKRMMIRANDLSNRCGKIEQSELTALKMNLRRSINNQEGIINTAGSIRLTAAAIDNSSGEIASARQASMSIKSYGPFINNYGKVSAGKLLRLETGLIDNSNGIINCATDLFINARDKIINNSGYIEGPDALSVSSQGFNNIAGSIIGGKLKFNIAENALENKEGAAITGYDVDICCGELQNEQGKIFAKDRLTINTSGGLFNNRLTQQSGGIVGTNWLKVECGRLENVNGIIKSDVSNSLNADNINNFRGIITSDGEIKILSNNFDNNEGLIVSTDKLNINTQGHALNNQNSGQLHGIHSVGVLKLCCEVLNNTFGVINAGWLNAALCQYQSKHQAKVFDVNDKNFVVESHGIINDGGMMQTSGSMELTVPKGNISNRNSHNDSGIMAHGRMNISAGFFDNSNGLMASAADALFDFSKFENANGKVISHYGNLNLDALGINNVAGLISASKNLNIDTHGNRIVNSGERPQYGIIAGGDMKLQSGELDNQSGCIESQANVLLSTDAFFNGNGKIVSQGNLAMKSKRVDNFFGLLRANGSMELNTNGCLLINRGIGDSGINTKGSLTLNVGDMVNAAGDIRCDDDIKINSTSLNNYNGSISSLKNLKINSGSITNLDGIIKARQGVQLQTLVTGMDNSGGIIGANSGISYFGGDLINRKGRVECAGNVTVNGYCRSLDNQDGIMISGGNVELACGELGNRQGTIQALGTISLLAPKVVINNLFGFIRSEDSLKIQAKKVINSHNHCLAGKTVTIEAEALDNSQGTLFAGEKLDVTAWQTLINNDGQMTSDGDINITDGQGGKQLRIANQSGSVFSRRHLDIVALSASGSGNIHALGNVTLQIPEKGYVNTSRLEAGGRLVLDINKHLVNINALMAGEGIDIKAERLENQKEAEIRAKGSLRISTHKHVVNYGLLDSHSVLLIGDILSNIGHGRIYGLNLVIKSKKFNNLGDGGKYPAIAARNYLAIGALALENQRNSSIYSGGGMSIGATLDEQFKITGQADTLINSGFIEALGDMEIKVNNIENINGHLLIGKSMIHSASYHEAVFADDNVRYDWAKVDFTGRDRHGVRQARLPDGKTSTTFDEYDYDRSVEDSVILKTRPGQIISGNNLSIHGSYVTNTDSLILAGGKLNMHIANLHNSATKGSRAITDVGTLRNWFANGGANGQGNDFTQGINLSDYQPKPLKEALELKTPAYLKRRRVESTTDDGLTKFITAAPLELNAPVSSLFVQYPGENMPFVLGLDPILSHDGHMLDSGYMQANIGHNDANLARFGDGMVERRLIRQQVIDLTGRCFLPFFSDDNQQYKALMDAGIAFARLNNLTLGVPPTDEQMKKMQDLPFGMVWLEKERFTFPNGMVRDVMAPRLYVHELNDRLIGSGVLLGDGTMTYAEQFSSPQTR